MITMSKRGKKHRRKSCKNKIAHETKENAYAAMRKLLKRNFIFHHIHPYLCPYCGKWHLGRTKKIIYKKFEKLKEG
jgi:hypothetical protein